MYIQTHVLCFIHRKMKFLVLCLLLAAGSSLAGVYRDDTAAFATLCQMIVNVS